MNPQNPVKSINQAIAGGLCVFVLLFLLGATVIPGGAGRYQIGTWALSQQNGIGNFGAFVLDTATGETQIVYKAELRENRMLIVHDNQLGKPFHSYLSKDSDEGRSIDELRESLPTQSLR